MSDDVIYEVHVHHNAVQAIRRVSRNDDVDVPSSPLEISTQLARNHQSNGCIDDCYRFDDAEQARSFAVLAMDFVKRLLEKRIEEIEKLDTGAEYDADGDTSVYRQ